MKSTKGAQQYIAKGTFSDQSVRDITQKVNWSSSDTNVAQLTFLSPFLSMIPGGSAYQNVIGAFAVTGTGGTSTIITAASTTPAGTIQATTTLSVNGSYHIRQNKHVPATSMPDWVNEPYARIWTRVYKIDPATGQIMVDKNGNWVVDYVIDAGPRSKYPVQPGESIGEIGCHMVSAAMILTKNTGATVNPKKFNDWLNNHVPMGYDEGNGPIWGVVQQYPNSGILQSWAHEIETIDRKTSIITWSSAQSYAIIDGALANNNMVVLRINGKDGHFKGHYVLVISGNNGNYKIYDPWIHSGDKDTQIDNLSDRYQYTGVYTATFNIITIH